MKFATNRQIKSLSKSAMGFLLLTLKCYGNPSCISRLLHYALSIQLTVNKFSTGRYMFDDITNGMEDNLVILTCPLTLSLTTPHMGIGGGYKGFDLFHSNSPLLVATNLPYGPR